MAEKRVSKRGGNKAWKHVYGVDRAYTARVDRLAERTIPGRFQSGLRVSDMPAKRRWEDLTSAEQDRLNGYQ